MRHSPFTAVYDACVLYPAPLRDFLMGLALTGRFRARWSTLIHAEWTRSLLAARPDIRPEQLDRTVALMNAAVPDALITGYEALAVALDLPDPGDRHVLAAAIRGGASVIVTFNVRDFPPAALDPFGIEAQHPDDFAEYLFNLDPAAVVQAARAQRARLVDPPLDIDRFLDVLRRQGLVQTATSLEAYRAVL